MMICLPMIACGLEILIRRGLPRIGVQVGDRDEHRAQLPSAAHMPPRACDACADPLRETPKAIEPDAPTPREAALAALYALKL